MKRREIKINPAECGYNSSLSTTLVCEKEQRLKRKQKDKLDSLSIDLIITLTCCGGKRGRSWATGVDRR